MGNRLRLDVQSPVGKIGRVKKAMNYYEKTFTELFWYMWDQFEHNPQNYNVRLKNKLIRYSHLYGKDIETLIEMSLDEFREKYQVKFEFNGKTTNKETRS